MPPPVYRLANHVFYGSVRLLPRRYLEALRQVRRQLGRDVSTRLVELQSAKTKDKGPPRQKSPDGDNSMHIR